MRKLALACKLKNFRISAAWFAKRRNCAARAAISQVNGWNIAMRDARQRGLDVAIAAIDRFKRIPTALIHRTGLDVTNNLASRFARYVAGEVAIGKALFTIPMVAIKNRKAEPDGIAKLKFVTAFVTREFQGLNAKPGNRGAHHRAGFALPDKCASNACRIMCHGSATGALDISASS